MLKIVLTSFFFIIELALHTISLLGQLVFCTYTLFGTLKEHYGNGRVVMTLDIGSDVRKSGVWSGYTRLYVCPRTAKRFGPFGTNDYKLSFREGF